MDGNDFDQVVITFQPELLVVCPLFRCLDLVAKPAQQALCPQLVLGRLLEQFGQMQVVGQYPFPRTGAIQAADDLLLGQQGLEHGGKAVLMPDLLVTTQAGHDLLPLLLITAQLVQPVGIVAEQVGRQCGADQPAVGLVNESLQDNEQITCLLPGKNRVLAVVDTGNGEGIQLVTDKLCLVVGADQDGDVTGSERLIADLRFPGHAGCQQGAYLMGTETGRLLRGSLLGQGFSPFPIGQHQAGQGRKRSVVYQKRFIVGHTGGPDRRELNGAFIKEK